MAGSSSFSEDMGEDVVMDILSRLPVKSILQCKSVCKSWYAIIKSPYFITRHLQRSNLINLNNSAAPLFVISYEGGGSVWWISSSSENNLSHPPAIDPDSPLISHPLESCILGPVKGIYCAVRCIFTAKGRDEDKIFLCNPALREVKSIPEITPMTTTTTTTTKPSDSKLHSSHRIFGFGYDSRSNDFKVVAVSLSYKTPPLVYSLSSNSWRKIQHHNDLPHFNYKQSDVFISHGNGFVNKLASACGMYVILSFDLGTEVFKILKLPSGVINYKNPLRQDIPSHKQAVLSVFNDSIVLFLEGFAYRNFDNFYEYEIFIMKEYGVEDSWTKLYNVGPILPVTSLIKFWNNGEILLAQEMEGESSYQTTLISFDPKCQQIKDLHIPRPLHIYTYMESLVSIN